MPQPLILTERQKAELMNQYTMSDYYKRLQLLALTLFKWENLPKSLNARFLERTLYYWGHAICVNDPTLGIVWQKVTPSGALNMYDEPISYTAYGTGYRMDDIDPDDCVIIRNNALALPTDDTIQLFSERLCEIERTLDVNVKNQKTPKVIQCDEKQKTTLTNLFKQIDGNMPAIFATKDLDINALKVADITAPFICDKLIIYKHEVWNEALTFLGINNANTDKKERLIVSEVDSNIQHIELSAKTMLDFRQKACDEINEKFGTEITVSFNEELTQGGQDDVSLLSTSSNSSNDDK